MLNKGTKHGAGSANNAKQYALREGKHKPHENEEVEILRGDPVMFAKVADNLDFVYKYTSGVIAFHPDDKPTDKQLEEIMNDYEKACFGDMDPNRFAQSFIAHKEGEKIHIHVLTARVDMQSGKSFNPMPPGWEKTFNAMANKHNFKNGFVRPDDPVHKRDLAVTTPQDIHQSDNPKVAIDNFISNRIELGLINDREDIVASLSELGEVTRTGKNYVSIKPEGFKKAIRLKGATYEQDFTREAERKNTPANRARQSRADRTDASQSVKAALDFSDRVKRKSEYNQQRYGQDKVLTRAELAESKPRNQEVRRGSQRQADSEMAQSIRDTVHSSDTNANNGLHRSTKRPDTNEAYNPEPVPSHKPKPNKGPKMQHRKRGSRNDNSLAHQLIQDMINSILKLITGGKYGYSEQEINQAIAETERANLAASEQAQQAQRDLEQQLRTSAETSSELEQTTRLSSEANQELDHTGERVEQLLTASDSELSVAAKAAQAHTDKVYEREQELNAGLELEFKMKDPQAGQKK